MLTESLLVAGIGAAVGIGARATSRSTGCRRRCATSTTRRRRGSRSTWTRSCLPFTVGATLAAAVALRPAAGAWMSSRANADRRAARRRTRHHQPAASTLVSRGLVVFQIVVTCVLLIGSLLQVRSILNQQTIDYGYDTGGIMSARMGLMDGDYPSPGRAQAVLRPHPRASCATDPEFEAVALTSRFRMVFSGNAPIEIDGKAVPGEPRSAAGELRAGDRRVLRRHRPEAARGRTFADDDLDARLPVAIVNAAFARKHFGNESALGRRFRTVVANAHAARPVADDRRRRLDGAHARPVQQPGRRRQRLLRAVLLDRRPDPLQPGAVRQPVRDHRREAARAASAPTRSPTRCGAR